MVERAIERERKFTAPDGFIPDFSGVAEVVSRSAFDLDATYLDTRALALTGAGWSLRQRTGGHDAGWHLKRPVEGGRLEASAPWSPEVPDALRQEAREVTGMDAVVPVARLRTRREETVLRLDGSDAALLAVDRVQATTASGDQVWREVEVELLPGADADLVETLAAVLIAAGAVPAGHASKVERALDAVPRPRPADSPDARAGDVMLAWADRQIGVIQCLEAGVREDAPDAVHKSRVATRRLRSLLTSFRRLFDRERVDVLRAELRWWGEVLGAPRDAEVLKANVGALVAELGPAVVPDAVRERLVHLLDAEHAAAHASMLVAVGADRAVALRAALADFLLDPPLRARANRPAEAVLPALWQATVDRVVDLRDRALSVDPEDEAAQGVAWHEVRKAAKAVRYSSEALVGSLGEAYAEQAKAWEQVTEALGAVQDAMIARDVLHRADAFGEADDHLAVLDAALAERRAASLAEGQEALERAISGRSGRSTHP